MFLENFCDIFRASFENGESIWRTENVHVPNEKITVALYPLASNGSLPNLIYLKCYMTMDKASQEASGGRSQDVLWGVETYHYRECFSLNAKILQ